MEIASLVALVPEHLQLHQGRLSASQARSHTAVQCVWTSRIVDDEGTLFGNDEHLSPLECAAEDLIHRPCE